jgi:hypothetical protein
MKNVSAVTKGNAQTIVVGGRWIGLVFNRGFIEGISTNGALKNYDKFIDCECRWQRVGFVENVDDRVCVSNKALYFGTTPNIPPATLSTHLSF